MHGIRIALSATLLAAVLAPALADAAQRNKPKSSAATREAFYRCKDQKGQTHYADSMPVACQGVDTEVLNDNGMVLRVIEGEPTRAARLKREAVEGKIAKEQEARRVRDRTLTETYLTVEDIERLRDQRLELLTAQSRVTEQNMANLRDRQARLEGQVARFKPYSDNENAPPLPDHLAEEMVNTVNSMRVYEQSLAKNREEQAALKATFDTDIRRFKELKGIR
ncbi:MAG: DUF4124 domain-containing protein [Steroidobacteraceae bacterium]